MSFQIQSMYMTLSFKVKVELDRLDVLDPSLHMCICFYYVKSHMIACLMVGWYY